tara:strand:- start:2557 stop:3108 length:552 start_codon:yes stop_codon:yes gene_type:complete
MSNIENELTYLINPQYSNQISKDNKNEKNKLSQDDITFYRKRIIQTTRDLLDNIDISYNLFVKDNFTSYIESCIKHYKIVDTHDIIQSEYIDLSNNNLTLDISNNNININYKDSNQLLFKEKKNVNTIENCMKINKIQTVSSKKEKIPKKKVVDLRDPSLKLKGVKKKSISIITNENEKKGKK